MWKMMTLRAVMLGRCHTRRLSLVISAHFPHLFHTATTSHQSEGDVFGTLATFKKVTLHDKTPSNTFNTYQDASRVQRDRLIRGIQKEVDACHSEKLNKYHYENEGNQTSNTRKWEHSGYCGAEEAEVQPDSSGDSSRLHPAASGKWKKYHYSEDKDGQTSNQPNRRRWEYSGAVDREVDASTEQAAQEVFGRLSPHRQENEVYEGDEGDAREERYQQARLERRHRPQYYGQMMKNLCKQRKLKDALKILEKDMPAVGAKPNNFCYQVLINECGRAGYTKKAFQLYNQMKKRALTVEPVAYTGLFNACANSPWPTTDGLTRASKLRQQLQEKGYIFNQTISHAMIKAFAWCGDINTAFQIVDEMHEQGLVITAETMCHLLQACVTDKTSGFRHAIMVWRKLRELRIQPSIYAYNLLVRVIKECGAGDPDLTSALLEGNQYDQKRVAMRMKHSSTKFVTEKILALSSNEIGNSESIKNVQDGNYGSDHKENWEDKTCEGLSGETIQYKQVEVRRVVPAAVEEETVLPNILGKKFTPGCVVGLGSLDRSEDRLALMGGPAGLVKQMAEDRVTPDMKTFTQLLDALPATTQAEESLLQSIRNVGVEPDTQFFNMLIRKRCFRGDAEAASDVLDNMQEYHLFPDLITFGCLALGCQELHSARRLIRDIETAGFRPNLEIMAAFVQHSVRRHNYHYTLTMLREMQRRNIDPDKRMLDKLEWARTRARKTMIELREAQAEDEKSKKRLKQMNEFLVEYKKWLRAVEVDQADHPWQQYQAQQGTTQEAG